MDYKVKLEEAKRLYQTANADQKYVLESLFPELRESEDERIRKSLIKHFREYESCTFDGLTSTKVLAWLERQDKGTNWKPSKEEMDVLYGLAYITNQYDEHKEEVITRLYQDLKREFFNGSSYENMFPNTEDGVRRRSTIQVLEYARSLDTYNQYGKADIDKNIAWLEKQGYTKKDVDDAYLKGICDAKHELEKQGEQESADKHEPKFKNGQWIVWQNKCYKVNYNGCGYGLIDQNGLSTSLEYGTIDESAHLWTIQDAKDGDVLAEDTCTFIIKKLNHDLTAEIYCCLYDDGDFELNSNLGFDDRCTYPATKSQRDTLFAKMKEAGYEWDFEKKELKKISQRMVSAEVKEALYDKPDAWSEKDESIALGIEQLCNCASLLNIAPDKIDKIRTLLKSLKDRYTWKPNSEQIECLHDAINHYHTNGYPASKLNELYEQMSKIYKL